MMLKRGTLLLLLSAIALGGAVLLLENKSGPRSQERENSEVEAASEKLFPFEEEEIEQFSVVRQQDAVDTEASTEESGAKETLSFVKADDETWQMTAPEEAMAEGGAIAFLLSQVTTPEAVPVLVDADNLEEFGLAEPASTVSLTANGREYLLHVGGLDFLGDKRYVQAVEVSADEPESADLDESLKIYAISGGIINAVNRPTAEWLAIDATAIEDATEADATEADDAEESDAAEAEQPDAEASPEAPSPDEPATEASEPAASESESLDTEEPNEAPNAAKTEKTTEEEDIP